MLGQSRATSLAGLQRQLRGLGIDMHLIGEPAAEPATELER